MACTYIRKYNKRFNVVYLDYISLITFRSHHLYLYNSLMINSEDVKIQST